MNAKLMGRARGLCALLLAVLVVCMARTTPAAAATYVYDALGRLTGVTYDDGTGTNYTLDPSGNRLAVANIDTSAPTSPGTPAFSAIAATTATATWTAATDNIGVTGYDYRLNGGTWTSAGNSLTVNLTGLVSATAYTFDVRARDAAGNAGTPATGTFTTLDNVPPSQPGALTFTNIQDITATAAWGASTDNVAVSGYDYRLNSGTWVSAGNVLTVNLTGLTGATNYTMDVRARDAAGNLSALRTSTFTTVATADHTPPSQVGALTFSAIGATSATASWAAASDNVAVVGYDYRLNGGTFVSLGNVLTVNLTGLSSGVAYTFDIRARDAAGNVSTTLTTSTFTTVDNIPPTTPGALSFSSIAGNSATVSWGAATDNVAVVGYDYRLNGGAWTSLGNVLSIGLTGLSPATTYTVNVRARDAAGNVSATPSSGAFTTPDTIPPSAPGALSFSSITASSATVSWGASTDNVGVVGYDYRLNGGSWNSVGNALSVGLSGLSPAVSYTVDVRARDAAGNASSATTGTLNTVNPITTAFTGGASFQGSGGQSTATATYTLTSSGAIQLACNTCSTSGGGSWISPATALGNYQAMATNNCPSPVGTYNQWLSLSTSRGWGVSLNDPGNQGLSAVCTITVSISATANPSKILGTAAVTVNIFTGD